MNTTPSFDRSLYLRLNAFAQHTGWLHEPARLFAQYGVVVFALLLLASWWRARRLGTGSMARALWSPVAVLVAVGINQPLVHHFAEARPYTVFPHALVLISRSTDPAFPSDHGTMAGAVAAAVLLSTWRAGSRWLGVAAVSLAALMAFTRVYVGAHYPLDMVAGLAVGAVIAAAVVLIASRSTTAVVRRLERTRLRPLLTAAV